MSAMSSSSRREPSIMIERCHSVIETASLVANPGIVSNDTREQSVVDELRHHAECLRSKTQNLSKDLSSPWMKPAKQRNQDWSQLQLVTSKLLSACQQLLNNINSQFLSNSGRFSTDSDASRPNSRLSKKSVFEIYKRKELVVWKDVETEVILDMISFTRAIELIRKLYSILSRGVVFSLPDVQLRTLEDQVYHGIYPSSCFKASRSSESSQIFASGNRQQELRDVVDFALDTLELARMPKDYLPAATTHTQMPSQECKSNDASTRHGQSPGTPTSRSESGRTTSTKPSVDTQSLTDRPPPSNTPQIRGHDSRNGAPNFEDEISDNEIDNISDQPGSATTANSQTNLGQQIQSLLQLQLNQDQKEKQVLERRVAQLEERCGIANRKAEYEADRANQAVNEAQIVKSKFQGSLEAQKREHLEELAESRSAYNKCHQKSMSLQMKLNESIKEKQRVSEELRTIQQQSKEKDKELEELRLQVRQVEEITKSWAARMR